MLQRLPTFVARRLWRVWHTTTGLRLTWATVALLMLGTTGTLLPASSCLAAGVPGEAKLRASDGEVLDFFGRSVAVSGDTAVVGAYQHYEPGSNSGAAYVFRYNGLM